MKNICAIKIKEHNGEEVLEDLTPAFPCASGRALLDRYRVFWHWHKAVEFFYMESGTLEYETPAGKMIFPAGSGGIINSGVLHKTCPLSDGVPTLQLLHITDPAFLFGDTQSCIYEAYFAPVLSASNLEVLALYPDDPAQKRILEQLKQSFDYAEHTPKNAVRLRSVLTEIWAKTTELFEPEKDTETGKNEKIKQMMRFVHEHFYEDIHAEDVAAAGFVSERECYRVFKAFLHTTPGGYIRNYRLRTACKMLTESDETVTQISLKCGFNSSSFFGKAFLSAFGMTPTDYRQNWQKSTNL